MAGSGDPLLTPSTKPTNRLAHCCAHLASAPDHYAVFMENNSRYLECCGAASARASTTPINSYLTADELAYIVNNRATRAC
jgi:long-chain acyl-CoA synthetase